MPGTAYGAANHKAFREGAMVMGAMGRDREEIQAPFHEQYVFLAHMANQHAVFGKRSECDSFREIGARRFGIFFSHERARIERRRGRPEVFLSDQAFLRSHKLCWQACNTNFA